MFYVDHAMYEDMFYTAANMERTSDILFYRDICAAYGGRVLEAACGNGRITLPLCEAGIDISGFDQSETMLEGARIRAKAQNLTLHLFQSDLLELACRENYDTIIMPFHTLQYLYTLDDERKALRNLRKCLRAGGHLVFDVFHPKLHRIVSGEGVERPLRTFTLSDGVCCAVFETLRYDRIHQVLQSRWRVVRGSREYFIQLDSRCYYPMELQALVESAGFKIEQVLGSFQGEPLNDNSSEQIMICSI